MNRVSTVFIGALAVHATLKDSVYGAVRQEVSDGVGGG